MADGNLPIDNTQLQQLIAALSQQMSTINPNLLASAMPVNNVSPANIASAMNPSVLLSSGLVDPKTIQAGIVGTYQQMLADWESRNNATLPYEASDAILAPVAGKYAGADEVSSFMNYAFDAIKNLGWTVDQVKTAIQKDSLGVPVPQSVKDNFAQYSADLTDYSKLATTQSTAKAKFEYDQAQKGITTAPTPTLEQARSKYYKDLGAPEMALLPDAGVPYRFDPSLFADKATSDLLSSQIAKQQGLARQAKTGSDYAQSQADLYTAKGNQVAAQTAGDKARQAYLDTNAKPDQITQVLDWFSRNLQDNKLPTSGGGGGALNLIGRLFGEDTTGKRTDMANEAGKQAMLGELARLNKIAPVSVETPYTKSQQNILRLQGAQASADKYNQDVADYVAKKLAAQGRTPNQDVMNQLLGYAAVVNKKK